MNRKDLFAAATDHHQAGRLADAEALYRQVLTAEPQHVNALHNLGIVGLQTGRPDLAIEMLGAAVALNDTVPDWQYNLALAYQARGRFDEAAACYARAIALKPDYAEAHTNLGNVLAQQEKLGAAAACYERVLRLKPTSPETHYNLANVRVRQGQLTQAIEHYRQALALNPGLKEAHVNLGRTLIAARQPEQAVAPLRRALQIEETAETKALMVEALQGLRSAPEDDINEIVARALSEPWTRPNRLVNAAVMLVRQDDAIRACMDHANSAWPKRLPASELFGASGLAALSHHKLLRVLLTAALIPGVAMERFLTNVRLVLLESAIAARTDAAADAEALRFYGALAQQCFIDNYVFDSTEGEREKVNGLRAALEAALESNEPLPALWPIAVAAYGPLHMLCNAQALLGRTWPEAMNDVASQQIREPLDERDIRKGIPALSAIDDNVSLAVKEQYEENPYPVWVATLPPLQPTSIDRHLKNWFPRVSFEPLGKEDSLDVLVAGCGTGQQAVDVARQFKGAAVLAIDLSLASLGYAKRKTVALGLRNIEYAQADILKLRSLGRSFDVIVSTGVLHHLADPQAGWRVLLSLLRPNGCMLVGLYSELARQDVVAAQDYAAEHGFGRDAADIRRFRQELMGRTDNPALRRVTEAPDFFSINECRDLLFHVQEHRWTIPRIKAFIAENGLTFLGFEAEAAVRRAYAARWPDDPAMIDLDRWHTFETEQPRSFLGMYQFWVQKRG